MYCNQQDRNLCSLKFHICVDEGKLYTWGYGSIKLGYETGNEKQLTPKIVQSLSSHTVVQASCGKDFTLGKILSSFKFFVRSF